MYQTGNTLKVRTSGSAGNTPQTSHLPIFLNIGTAGAPIAIILLNKNK